MQKCKLHKVARASRPMINICREAAIERVRFMYPRFTVIPHYQLDDQMPWLEGIDPLRNYWIAINSDRALIITLSGVKADSFRNQLEASWQTTAVA